MGTAKSTMFPRRLIPGASSVSPSVARRQVIPQKHFKVSTRAAMLSDKRPPQIAARERALLGVQAQFDRYHKIANATVFNGHDIHLMRELKLLDASIGPRPAHNAAPTAEQDATSEPSPVALTAPPNVAAMVTFSLLIDEKYSNINGVLHGGAVGVILDMVTTAAIAPLSRPGYWEFLAGVTRTMSTNYLKPVVVGTLVHVHGHLYSLGKTMAFIKGYITSPDGKVVYVTCDVNKVGLPAKKEHLEYKVPWDEMWDEDGKARL